MGKRRQELDHKTREEMEQETDEEEDIIEENYERVTIKASFFSKFDFSNKFYLFLKKEPLRQDQLVNIQSRKKLIAKRRVNDSTTASTKPASFTVIKNRLCLIRRNFLVCFHLAKFCNNSMINLYISEYLA